MAIGQLKQEPSSFLKPWIRERQARRI